MLVIDRGNPALVGLVGDLAHQSREFGVTRHVVGHARHAAGQFAAGEESPPTLGGGDHELDGREPVTVEDQYEVGFDDVEDLAAQAVQSRVQRALVAVVQFAAQLFGQDDGWNVREETCADDFTHGWFLP